MDMLQSGFLKLVVGFHAFTYYKHNKLWPDLNCQGEAAWMPTSAAFALRCFFYLLYRLVVPFQVILHVCHVAGNLPDLSWTVSAHRTCFKHRSFSVAIFHQETKVLPSRRLQSLRAHGRGLSDNNKRIGIVSNSCAQACIGTGFVSPIGTPGLSPC